MTTTDVSEILNSLYSEMTGATDITVVDASNIVDVGKALKKVTSVDTVYGSIIDKVGKIVIKNRLYRGKFPKILRDGWEFGSIMETLRIKPYKATKDPSVAPVSGTTYSQDDYSSAEVVAKYYTDRDAFQIDYWKPSDQLWSAFESMEAMGRFLSSIEVAVANSMTVRLQGIIKTAINNMIAHTVYKDFPNPVETNYSAASFSRCINLLKLYNDASGTSLTVNNCRKDQDFLKFAVKTILNTYERLQDMSQIFNIDGEDTFNNPEDINITLLSTFANDIKVNMQSGVYNKELVSLPTYDTVPFWQASGVSYDEGVIGEINVTIKTGDSTTQNIEFPGVMGIMYSNYAIGVTCERRKTTTHYNAQIDQTHFFEKYSAQYYNDPSENFVVFYIA